MKAERAIREILREINIDNEISIEFSNYLESKLWMALGVGYDQGRADPMIANKRKVGKYDKFGVLVDTYPSAYEADRRNKASKGSVSDVCRGRKGSLFGYYYKYIDE